MQSDHLVILGMRRSGTSLLAGFVNRIGYYAESTARRADRSNPDGYFESRSILDLNEGIINDLGGTGDFPPKMNEGWANQKSLAKFKAQAAETVDRYNVRAKWVMKDTRFSLTLPIWKPFLPQDTRYMICIRNPLACLFSWRKMARTFVKPSVGYKAWESYTSFALKNTNGLQRQAFFMEDYHEHADEQRRRIAEFVGAPSESQSLGSLFKDELAHHKVGIEELLADPSAPGSTKSLYLQLEQNGRNSTGLDSISDSLAGFVGYSPPLTLRLRQWSKKNARRVVSFGSAYSEGQGGVKHASVELA